MTQLRSGGVTAETARRTWDRFGAAWESGDLSGIDELFSDGVVYHVPPFPDLDK